MNPTDIRDMNWTELSGKLEGLRETVYRAMLACGPATTADIAARSGLSILTVRPRVTELVQLGFARCFGKRAKEGLYLAVSQEDALAAWRERIAAAAPTQTMLKL